MKLIWKRPDGYLNAKPDDFRVLHIGGHSNLWIHKTDRDTFPFRLSGDWANDAFSRRLNNLVSLLDAPDEQWKRIVEKIDDEFEGDKSTETQPIHELIQWIESVKKSFKGSSWEEDIVQNTLVEIQRRLTGLVSDLSS